MWECPKCGCQGIAGSLTFCPMCFKEREMPTSVAGAAPANANAAPGEPGYVAPDDAQDPGSVPEQDAAEASEDGAPPEPQVPAEPARPAGMQPVVPPASQ